MRLTIDNHDGLGVRDYTPALSSASPPEITRAGGGLARCVGLLDLNAVALPAPVRGARVRASSDSGTELFYGRIAATPGRLLAGVGTMGPMHQVSFSALADEIAEHSLAHGTAVTHSFADGEGVLHLAAPSADAVREQARDLTVSGEIEPAAYVTEYFMGDGTTAVFDLSQRPFIPAGSAALLDERFDGPSINPGLWNVTDTGSFFRLGAQGLMLNGGNGFDKQTTIASAAPIEIGGTLAITADGVMLNAASDGVVCGLYVGTVERGTCLAGFNVRQVAGSTVVRPLVNGVEAGSSFTVLGGHRYTLRLRLHCPETIRFAAISTAIVDGEQRSFGGGTMAAPVTLVFEARDLGAASNTPATVLHSVVIAASAAACIFAPVNSVQLIGSIASCRVEQMGSAWITTTASDGTTTVRVIGDPGDGVDCSLSANGRITFFGGRVPLANERITASYRGRRRAVARLRSADAGDAASDAWQGSATHPAPRTSADCENVAQAALAFANARAATLRGTYTVVNPAAEIVPGDVLAITSENITETTTLKLVVRSVSIEDRLMQPEMLVYRVEFANAWSTSLNVQMGGTLEADALVPATAGATPPPVLANLPALAAVSVSSMALAIDAGVAPPTGGGFEVRRRDWAFGPGTDGDLVLRSPVRNFTIPRSAQIERFFIRMYDASGTPVYSRFSSAIVTNLPVA